MKFRMFINEHLMFESSGGDLTVTKDVLDIGGFGGGFESVSFAIRDDAAEVRFLWGGELSTAEVKLMRQGEFIQTIKALRARKELPLKEAKDICDKWRDSHPREWERDKVR
jgi:hypothetical protein